MEVVILIIVLAIVLVGGGIAAFVHGRGSATIEAPPRPRPTAAPAAPEVLEEPVVLEPAPEIEVEVPPVTFRERLAKARGTLSGYLGSILSRGVDADTWDELEEALLRADIGVPTTIAVLDELRAQARADSITDSQELLERLKVILKDLLGGHDLTLDVAGAPAVWLFVGVNGVGKTTTIGKLAKREHDRGHEVVLAAGDTFRAAAVDQLAMWAERAGADIVRSTEGADPSSVIFDSIEHAATVGADLVMADTAGRLHTKTNLMEELRKVRRVADKGAGRVSEVLLVIDATTGQNGLTQAAQFTDAVEVTGVVLTKLDGSARGGIVLAIQTELGIPVKLVGLGEGAEDLVEFDADEFVEALFAP